MPNTVVARISSAALPPRATPSLVALRRYAVPCSPSSTRANRTRRTLPTGRRSSWWVRVRRGKRNVWSGSKADVAARQHVRFPPKTDIVCTRSLHPFCATCGLMHRSKPLEWSSGWIAHRLWRLPSLPSRAVSHWVQAGLCRNRARVTLAIARPNEMAQRWTLDCACALREGLCR